MSKASFANVPLYELVLGIQFPEEVFQPIDVLNLYSSNMEGFPNMQEQPPLPAIIEDLEKPSSFSVPTNFVSRKFFVSNEGNHLLQLQPNRLLMNWRKEAIGQDSSESAYPHFESIYVNFISILNYVDSSIASLEKVNQYEITFIDHFYFDELGLDPSQMLNIFNLITFPDEIKGIDFTLQFPRRDINSIIYIKMQSAKKNSDGRDLLRSEITCRGFNGSGIENIKSWFELSHQICVELFLSILTKEVKQKLGYKHE